MKRIYTLDYLRGFAACGIMFYHYANWNYGEQDASTLIGRIGIYGVSVFYVLSGLTLYLVYFKNFVAKEFFIKRVFRIFPLLWIATLAMMWLNKPDVSYMTLVLNFTGLFGFVRPWDGITTGVWSIGNELVFYALFPLLVFAAKYQKLLYVAALSFAVYLFFALTFTGDPLKEQWSRYVNPFNQFFLFVAGFMIGHYKVKIKSFSAIALIVSGVIFFCLYEVSGDLVNIVRGLERFVFTAICIMICAGFYYLPFKLPFHWGLKKIGEASYSIYLLHPLVLIVAVKSLAKVNIEVPKSLLIACCVVVTIVGSYFMYVTVEKYFIRMGAARKKLAVR